MCETWWEHAEGEDERDEEEVQGREAASMGNSGGTDAVHKEGSARAPCMRERETPIGMAAISVATRGALLRGQCLMDAQQERDEACMGDCDCTCEDQTDGSAHTPLKGKRETHVCMAERSVAAKGGLLHGQRLMDVEQERRQRRRQGRRQDGRQRLNYRTADKDTRESTHARHRVRKARGPSRHAAHTPTPVCVRSGTLHCLAPDDHSPTIVWVGSETAQNSTVAKGGPGARAIIPHRDAEESSQTTRTRMCTASQTLCPGARAHMCAASQVLRPGDYAQIRPDETTLVCLLSGVVFGYVSHMAWTSSSDANACSYDICRWERARIARRCSLDGERIHPHPGMPVERPPKQTALALTMVKKWEEREEEGRVIISYRHAAGLDDRLEIKTVTFPGGKSGHGMFAVRDFCKYEYITTWMGTPAAGGGGQ